MGLALTNSTLIVLPRWDSFVPNAAPASTIVRARAPAAGRIEPDVDEPGTGDLDAGDAGRQGQTGGDLGGQLARVRSDGLGELERRVGRPVPVLAVPRPLQRKVRDRETRRRSLASRLGERGHDGEQGGGEFCGVHSRTSLRLRTSTAPAAETQCARLTADAGFGTPRVAVDRQASWTSVVKSSSVGVGGSSPCEPQRLGLSLDVDRAHRAPPGVDAHPLPGRHSRRGS